MKLGDEEEEIGIGIGILLRIGASARIFRATFCSTFGLFVFVSRFADSTRILGCMAVVGGDGVRDRNRDRESSEEGEGG